MSTGTETSESKALHFPKNMYLGSEGVCLVRFAKMTYTDQAEVMADKGLEVFSRHKMYVIPISDLVAAKRQSSFWSVTKKMLKLMRIRDVTTDDMNNSLPQHTVQDKLQSPTPDSHNVETLPNAGSHIPAF